MTAPCKWAGHDWSEWSPWKPVFPVFEILPFDPGPIEAKVERFEAHRWRTCKKCRSWERQSYVDFSVIAGTHDQNPESFGK